MQHSCYSRKKHRGAKDENPRRQALTNKKDDESNSEKDNPDLPPKIRETNGRMNMICLDDKLICGELVGGGREPADRKAHVIEEKSTPKMLDVNSVATTPKSGKLKKVDMV